MLLPGKFEGCLGQHRTRKTLNTFRFLFLLIKSLEKINSQQINKADGPERQRAPSQRLNSQGRGRASQWALKSGLSSS